MTPEQTLYDPERWTRIMDPDLRAEAQQWARDNALDPSDIALATVTLETVNGQRVIRYTHYLRNAEGLIPVDPDNPNQAAAEERTVPCLVEPPEEWIEPEDRP